MTWTRHPAPTREDLTVREIDLDAETAVAAIPEHLRVKHRPVPAGSTRLDFSDRAARPDTRKA